MVKSIYKHFQNNCCTFCVVFNLEINFINFIASLYLEEELFTVSKVVRLTSTCKGSFTLSDDNSSDIVANIWV